MLLIVSNRCCIDPVASGQRLMKVAFNNQCEKETRRTRLMSCINCDALTGSASQRRSCVMQVNLSGCGRSNRSDPIDSLHARPGIAYFIEGNLIFDRHSNGCRSIPSQHCYILSNRIQFNDKFNDEMNWMK